MSAQGTLTKLREKVVALEGALGEREQEVARLKMDLAERGRRIEALLKEVQAKALVTPAQPIARQRLDAVGVPMGGQHMRPGKISQYFPCGQNCTVIHEHVR